MKILVEFLGRSSLILMIVFLMREVFVEKLNYNLYYGLGGLCLIIWMYLPFYKAKEKKEDD